MCRIVPSSGQPASLWSFGGKRVAQRKPSVAPIGMTNRRTRAPPSNGAYSEGHSPSAIRNGTKMTRIPITDNSRRLGPDQRSFSIHQGQGKLPRRNLTGLRQLGHLTILYQHRIEACRYPARITTTRQGLGGQHTRLSSWCARSLAKGIHFGVEPDSTRYPLGGVSAPAQNRTTSLRAATIAWISAMVTTNMSSEPMSTTIRWNTRT